MAYAPLPSDYYLTAQEQFLQQQQQHHPHEYHQSQPRLQQQHHSNDYLYTSAHPNYGFAPPMHVISNPPYPMMYNTIHANTAPYSHHFDHISHDTEAVQTPPSPIGQTRPEQQEINLESSADAISVLNLRVLKRHVPETEEIVYRTSYAVVYTFAADSGIWEKIGKEGTLFVIRLTNGKSSRTLKGYMQHSGGNDHKEKDRERFAVVVLNRRGMDNFVLDLDDVEDEDEDGEKEIDEDGGADAYDTVRGGVQLEGDFIILQGQPHRGPHEPEIGIVTDVEPDSEAEAAGNMQPVVFGLWVFEEERTSTAGKRAECAAMLRDCKNRSRRRRGQGRTQSAAAASPIARPPDGTAHGLRRPPEGYKLSEKDSYHNGKESPPTHGGAPDLMALLNPNLKIKEVSKSESPSLAMHQPVSDSVTWNQRPDASEDVLGALFRSAAARAQREHDVGEGSLSREKIKVT